MIELHKEKTVNYTAYQAIDGTIFNDKEECRKYEKSALAVLLSRYTSYVVNSGTEEDIFGHGSQDYIIDVAHVSDATVADTIFQLYALHNTYWDKDTEKERTKRVRDRIQRAVLNKDYIFIGRGIDGDDDFYIYETLGEVMDNIKKACKIDGKEENE